MRTAQDVGTTWGDSMTVGRASSRRRSAATRAVVFALLGALGLTVLGAAYFAANAGDGYPDRVEVD